MAMLALPVLAALTGDIQGTIFDPNGAVVNDAKVTILNKGTNASRVITSDSRGEFSGLQLEIGTYLVRVEKQGFRTYEVFAEVASGQQTHLNITMELGQASQTITVESEATPTLDVSSSQVASSFDAQQVRELPNIGRDPVAYATLAPGVAPVSRDNPFLGSGSYNSNGQRGRANNITVDNITATDISTTGSSGTGTFSLDAIQEFKLISNNFSAEFGRNSGSQAQIITKSGTNNFHGTAYWFHQNAFFNARNFFDQFTLEHPTGKVTPFIRNQWGFTAGGPLVRNHLFAFGHYQGVKNRGAGSSRVARVLTPAQAAAITDPTSAALFAAVGAPTSPTGRLSGAAPNKGDQYSWSLRIDETWHNGKDSITSRYGTNPNTAVSPGLTFIGTNLPNFGANVVSTARAYNFGYTHIFTPTVVNQFRFAFGRSNPAFQPFTTLKAPFAPQLQISGLDTLGVSFLLPQGRVQNTFQYSDSVSWSLGSHSVKFGADVFRYQANSFFDANFRGFFGYGDISAFQKGTPLSFSQRVGSSVRGNRATDAFFFIQDDIRFTSSLTLNLGVRLESSGGVSEVNKVLANLDPNNNTPLGGGGTGPLGGIDLGGSAFQRNYNWAPRLGGAWNPHHGKLVVRGGYGWAYDYIYLNPITNLRFAAPFVPSFSLNSTAIAGANSYAALAAGTSQAQKDARAAIGSFLPTQVNFGDLSPVRQDLANPRTDQWNGGVEYQLRPDLVVKASYIGAKGKFLQVSLPINLLPDSVRPAAAVNLADETNRLGQFSRAFGKENGTASGSLVNNRLDHRFNNVTQVQSVGTSIYHSGQFEFVKQFRHGLSFQGSYTYGHSIDDTSDALGVLVNDTSQIQDPRNLGSNRGNSQFDLRHRFVLSHYWELPFGNHLSGVAGKLLGGWAMSGEFSIQSGFKSSVFSSSRRGISDNFLLGGGVVRANGDTSAFTPVPDGSAVSALIPDTCSRGVNTNTKTTCTNTSGFPLTQPLLGNIGTSARNSLPLARFQDWDWSFIKNTRIYENHTLQFRAEFYNIFNHTNFSGFVSNLTSRSFGTYQSTASNSRQIQIALKYTF